MFLIAFIRQICYTKSIIKSTFHTVQIFHTFREVKFIFVSPALFFFQVFPFSSEPAGNTRTDYVCVSALSIVSLHSQNIRDLRGNQIHLRISRTLLDASIQFRTGKRHAHNGRIMCVGALSTIFLGWLNHFVDILRYLVFHRHCVITNTCVFD